MFIVLCQSPKLHHNCTLGNAGPAQDPNLHGQDVLLAGLRDHVCASEQLASGLELLLGALTRTRQHPGHFMMAHRQKTFQSIDAGCGERCTSCLRGTSLLHQLLHRATQLIPGLRCLRKYVPFKLMHKQRWGYTTRWSCTITDLGVRHSVPCSKQICEPETSTCCACIIQDGHFVTVHRQNKVPHSIHDTLLSLKASMLQAI